MDLCVNALRSRSEIDTARMQTLSSLLEVAVENDLVVCRIDIFGTIDAYLKALFDEGGVVQAVSNSVVRFGQD